MSPELVVALLAHLPEGVLLLDLSAGEPMAYFANGTPTTPLARMMGWPEGGAEVGALRAQLEAGEAVVLELPRDGGSVPLELLPLPSAAGGSRHYIGVERAPGYVAVGSGPAALPVVLREDRLTGLAHRDWFFELYHRDFAIAAREHRALSLFLIDVDALSVYNDTFGRSAGDSAIRLVGRAVQAGMRRASDLVAREAGGRYIALAIGQTAEQASRHAEQLATRVRELHLHHPRSKVARFVTVSIGAAHWSALPRDTPAVTPEALYGAALAALAECRRAGRNRIVLTELGPAA